MRGWGLGRELSPIRGKKTPRTNWSSEQSPFSTEDDRDWQVHATFKGDAQREKKGIKNKTGVGSVEANEQSNMRVMGGSKRKEGKNKAEAIF